MFRYRLPTLLLVTVLVALVALAWTGHSILIEEGNLPILGVRDRLGGNNGRHAVLSLPLTVVGIIGCIYFLVGYGFAKIAQWWTKK